MVGNSLRSLTLAVDSAHASTNNKRGMTLEERQRVGKLLRARRIQEGLTQSEVAQRMHAAGEDVAISLGTLQAIEGAWYPVRDTNVERYALFFQTKVSTLLRADEPRPLLATDPLLQDLHEEHLLIARRYMHARKHTRAAVEQLIDPQLDATRGALLAAIVLRLAGWSLHGLTALSTALESATISEALLSRVLHGVATNAEYAAAIDAMLEGADTPPTPAVSSDLLHHKPRRGA